MKIRLIISPFQNLFFHLERASGAFKDLFSEKYRAKAEELTPTNIFTEFYRTIGDSRGLSRSLKQQLSNLVMPDEIPATVSKIFSRYASKLAEVLLSDADRYLAMWREELNPKLETFKKTLENVKDELLENFKRIENITRLPFRFDQLEIFLIDALSEEYGSMSEVLGLRSLALGVMNTADALKEITFSLAKLNLGDTINNVIPEDLVDEEKDISTALAKLIANEIHPVLAMPLEVKNKVDEYINSILTDWKNYIQNPGEYSDIGHFFKEILLPKILGEE